MANIKFSKYFRKTSKTDKTAVLKVKAKNRSGCSEKVFESCSSAINTIYDFETLVDEMVKESGTKEPVLSKHSNTVKTVQKPPHNASFIDNSSLKGDYNIVQDDIKTKDSQMPLISEDKNNVAFACNKIGNVKQKQSISTLNLSRRRPGKIYKLKLSEKTKGRKSEYFKNSEKLKQNHWIPPRSPYSLIQEDLYHSPWQLLIATIFLTKTQAKKAIPQILRFLERWPTPQDLLLAKQEEIVEILTPLGIQHVRSALIRRFTVEFLEKDWLYPEELYGVGKYGNDSYRIFCVNEWRSVTPDDNKLNLYKNWLTENAEKLGI